MVVSEPRDVDVVCVDALERVALSAGGDVVANHVVGVPGDEELGVDAVDVDGGELAKPRKFAHPALRPRLLRFLLARVVVQPQPGPCVVVAARVLVPVVRNAHSGGVGPL